MDAAEQRLGLIDDRIDHAMERIEDVEAELAQLEEDRRHATGVFLEKVVIWLIVAELVLGTVELLWMVRHA